MSYPVSYLFENWEEIKQYIREEYGLTDISFNIWIKNMKLQSVKDHVAVIQIPSDQSHALSYITGKFKKDYADDPTSEVNALVNTDDPDAIIDYLIDRRIEKKSPEEKRELLIHTCANMIQGYNAIGKFEAPYDTISKKRKSQLANEASSEDEYSVEDLLEDSNTDTHNPDDHSDDSNNGPDAPGTPSGPDNPGEPDDHGGSDSEDDDEDEPDDEPEPDM